MNETTGARETPRELVRAPAARRRRRSRRWIPPSIVSLVVGFALWQFVVVVFHPNPLIIVAPSDIAAKFVEVATQGNLAEHFGVSMRAFAIGLALSAVLGIALGLVMGASERVRVYLDPWVSAFYATPSVALAPLFVVWLGFGTKSTIAIVTLLAFFPVVISTMDGTAAIQRDLVEVGVVFKANRWEMFRLVLLPGALGPILTGLRLAVGRGLVGVVVADLFGSSSGLGFLIVNASLTFDTAAVFLATIMLALIGVTLNRLIYLAQRRTAPWTVN